MCAKDENNKIFRNDNWFNPINEPNIELINKNIIRVDFSFNKINRINGIIFCRDNIINIFIHLIFFKNFTIQKWNGALPILNIITIVINVFVSSDIFNSKISFKKNMDISNIFDDTDWIIKYFIVCSILFKLLSIEINGRTIMILSSILNHIHSIELDEIDKINDITKKKKKKNIGVWVF